MATLLLTSPLPSMNFTPELPFLGAVTPPLFSSYPVNSGGLSHTSLTQEKLGRKKGWGLLLSLKLCFCVAFPPILSQCICCQRTSPR